VTAAAVGDTIDLQATVAGGTAFVRAEVRRTSSTGKMVALTNPIFLTASAG
jgi:hypothetical protein